MSSINLCNLRTKQMIRTQCDVMFQVTEINEYYRNNFTLVYKIKAVKMPLSSYLNPVRVFYYYNDGQSAFGQPFCFDIKKIEE